MEEDELRRLWYEWANVAISGQVGRVHDAVESALAAIRGGAAQEDAVAAAQGAADRWSQTTVYSPPVGHLPDEPVEVERPPGNLPDVLPPSLEPAADAEESPLA